MVRNSCEMHQGRLSLGSENNVRTISPSSGEPIVTADGNLMRDMSESQYHCPPWTSSVCEE